MRRLWLLILMLAGCALGGCRPQLAASPAVANMATPRFAPTATPTVAPIVLTILHTNDSEGNTDPCG